MKLRFFLILKLYLKLIIFSFHKFIKILIFELIKQLKSLICKLLELILIKNFHFTSRFYMIQNTKWTTTLLAWNTEVSNIRLMSIAQDVSNHIFRFYLLFFFKYLLLFIKHLLFFLKHLLIFFFLSYLFFIIFKKLFQVQFFFRSTGWDWTFNSLKIIKDCIGLFQSATLTNLMIAVR